MQATAPLISIVIPTFGRPKYLPQSVASALEGLGNRVEVIVVPNGTDQSWRDSLEHFSKDERVRIEPISVAHANAARNHGIQVARGKYIRFLDDDDYIYPNATEHQCALLEKTQSEICSGGIDTITENGLIYGERKVPKTKDFVESILHPNHVSLPTSHVFLRASIAALVWDEGVPLGQDKQWMYTLCEIKEWRWVRTDTKVGAWRHHTGPRISSTRSRGEHAKIWAQMLIHTVTYLSQQGRLYPNRGCAAAASLWRMICGNYFLDPSYWDSIMKHTQKLFPGTFPGLAIYNYSLGRLLPPRVILVSSIPIQSFRRKIRIFLAKVGLRTSALPP